MYYKVLRSNGDNLVSIASQGAAQLVYSRNFTTHAPKELGGVFIFDSLENVRQFMRMYSKYEEIGLVFECEATNPQPLTFCTFPEERYITKFWEHLKNNKQTWCNQKTPEGTYIADAIILGKRVF